MSVLYFAYGSNLGLRRLRSPDRAPSAEKLAIGWLNGFRLVFDKVSADGSGKCDCERSNSAHDQVYGVVFRIDDANEVTLDAAEGLGYGYEKKVVDLVTASGVVSAAIYTATHKQPGLKPYDWYKEHVLRGAIEQGLPAEYVRAIHAVKAKPDPDQSRALREMSIWVR